MSKKSNKNIILIAIIAALLGFVALVVNNYTSKTSFKYKNQTAEELKPDQNKQDAVNKAVNEAAKTESSRIIDSKILKIQKDDFVLGDKNAPVTIIEYASLSCPHCASFAREALPRIQEEYIDNGKVKFVYRDFPLNQQALVAAMYALCDAADNSVSDEPEKYFATLKSLFKSQDSWAFDRQFAAKLESIAKLNGMKSTRFQNCINNQDLQEDILNKRMDAAKSLQIKSTPSFFVNDEISEGYVDYKTIKALIDKKLSETQN